MSEVQALPTCDCAPPAKRAADRAADPRAELLRVAGQLAERYNARLLAEYLRLRRVVR